MSPSEFSEFAPLRLKRNEERRLRAGHLWVYSNEVDVAATPLKPLAPGQPVEIQAHNGKSLGTGYANPHSLICARLVSRDHHHPFGPSLLVHRLKVALGLRQRLFAQPFYRLVHGEADGLPGLVVDRYNDICVAQITTAGMEVMQEAILQALDKVIGPRAVLWRNDAPIRELEGLESYVTPAAGELPETLEVPEGGARFAVPLLSGQKTGWFFDQRDNRARFSGLAKGLRVLDVFSYLGGWGIPAALAGAREVVCVDDSATALEGLAYNAELNGVADRVTRIKGDAFQVLKDLREQRERFDLIVTDPPAFIKRKKDFREGALAYRRLNERAMQLLERDGLLTACSCSHHMPREALIQGLLAGARHLDRNLQVLYQGQQGPDHPVHPAIPETDYLKAAFTRVLPA
ncbi:MAG: class I SAM-dependent rRNA methyltransferase [Candidatus Competibacteraceae bacterium]|nr:class I SAM-dependent rRNA methyltransferase [Candidatus Competibacteraceae bacterium]